MGRGRTWLVVLVGIAVLCGAAAISFLVATSGETVTAQQIPVAPTTSATPDPTTTTVSTPAVPAPVVVASPAARPMVVPVAPWTAPRVTTSTVHVTQTTAPPQPDTVIDEPLRAMPSGTVQVSRATAGQLTVQLDVTGLAPGSVHAVELVTAEHGAVISFPAVTADATGRVRAVVAAWWHTALSAGGRVLLLAGDATEDDGSPAAQPIAETNPLPAVATTPSSHTYPLVPAVTVGGGTSTGALSGAVRLVYHPATETLTVTISAAGLAPGAHAVDIHAGSCASQGQAGYLFTDLTADAHGRVTDQTRTLTGVAGPLPASGWYVDIHQGGGAEVSSALDFRPLLCADF